MNVILSIKPEFCERIRSGDKKYEFRKVRFKIQEDIDRVFIYCTSPVKKIIGFFEIDEIIEDAPINLWAKYNNGAGIEKEQFFLYYGKARIGYAIKISNSEFFEPFDPKEVYPGFSPPQSFCYLKDDHQFMSKNIIL